ncbi:MAG TPA: alpha/beta fold hydrolase [Polyangia bacterium]|nr:alpha/beta fold hydrolase [Polyangia bacterium]
MYLVWLVAALGALMVVAAVVAGAWWLHRRVRRRRIPRRAPAPRYPVVLAHGVMGFDEIAVGARRHGYFRGVRERLESLGAVVHRARVPPSASVAVRAERLAELLRSLPGGKVNVVAHSMGGLDARYAIARLGLANRVASLTTIGTPHLGTPLADIGHGLLELFQIKRLLKPIITLDAFHDLTTSRMAAFNREVRDAQQVAYLSIVARAPRGRLNPLLRAPYRWLAESAGENDGLVPVDSQRWGEVLREIEADHWAQIGWSSEFDAPALFEELVRELAARGF